MPTTALGLAGLLLLGLAGLLLLGLLVLPVTAGEDTPADPVERALASPQATGLLVTLVVDGSQASELGLAPGDVIVSYGGMPAPSIEALRTAMQSASAESVELAVVRPDGSQATLALQPGPIGVQLAPVEKGKGVEPLPPATDVTFDFSSLADAPHDDWYDFTVGGEHAGFEHGLTKLEDGKLVMRREVAFDGGEQWGVNHFDVTAVMTAEALPKLVSLRFENPIVGYAGQGVVSADEKGNPILRYAQTQGDETTTVDHVIPGDLPAISEYVVETLACFMPREKGACFHYRPVTDMSGAIGRPAALLVLGEEVLEIGDAEVKAVKVQVHTFGGGPSTAFWINARGRVVKADYVGAVTLAAAKEDCLKDLHHGLRPRTAE